MHEQEGAWTSRGRGWKLGSSVSLSGASSERVWEGSRPSAKSARVISVCTNVPALLHLAPQHCNSFFILLPLVCGNLEVVLHPDALLRNMVESLSQAHLACLGLRDLLRKGIAFLRDLRQRQTKLCNYRGEDTGIKRLWPRGIWRVGQRFGVELPLKFEREVYGSGAVRVVVNDDLGECVGGGHDDGGVGRGGREWS